jgi:predicted secreted Zn-dependent protease
MNRELQEVEQEKTCKYLKTEKSESIQYQQLKEINKERKKYDRTYRMILKPGLNAKNTITATGTVGGAAVPV